MIGVGRMMSNRREPAPDLDLSLEFVVYYLGMISELRSGSLHLHVGSI